MRVGGFNPFTLSDFPGHVACVVSAQGCNFRCPYCHNAALWGAGGGGELGPGQVAELLAPRVGKADAVVFSGGEPTLQPDLAACCRAAKTLGLAVQLDTNGSRPGVVEALLAEGLLDRVAMDIKAPWDAYARAAGGPVDTRALRRCAEAIVRSGVAHEFRTVEVAAWIGEGDLARIKAALPAGAHHVVRPFEPALAADAAACRG